MSQRNGTAPNRGREAAESRVAARPPHGRPDVHVHARRGVAHQRGRRVHVLLRHRLVRRRRDGRQEEGEEEVEARAGAREEGVAQETRRRRAAGDGEGDAGGGCPQARRGDRAPGRGDGAAEEFATGAGFVIPILGQMMRMPGLPAKPVSEGMTIDNNGVISGLS